MRPPKLPLSAQPDRSAGRSPRARSRSRASVITVLDTLAWLVATVMLAALVGNSTLLQVGSAIAFTLLWFVAVRLWA